MRSLGESLEILSGVLFDPEDIVELRSLTEDHSGGARTDAFPAKHFGTSGVLQWIQSNNGPGRGVYFGVNPRKAAHGSGKKGSHVDGDVKLYRSVFVDFDDQDAASVAKALKAANLPPPSLSVNSREGSGTFGLHLYWKFSTPIDNPTLWAGYQRRLIRLLSSDRTIVNPSRVMRLPGTANHKRNGTCQIRKVGEVYNDVRELGIEPVPETEWRRESAGIGAGGSPKLERLTRKTLLYLQVGASTFRNQNLFNAASDLYGNGFDESWIIEHLLPVAQQGGSDFPEWEIRKTIRSAVSKPRNPGRPVDAVEEALFAAESTLGSEAVPNYVRRFTDRHGIFVDCEGLLDGSVFSFAQAKARKRDAGSQPSGLPPVEAPSTVDDLVPLAGSAPANPETRDAQATPDPSALTTVEAFLAPRTVKAPRKPIKPAQRTGIITNVHPIRTVEDGKAVTRLISKPIDQIGREVLEALDGWPKRAGSLGLFTLRDCDGEPALWSLTDTNTFFAAIHQGTGGIRWAEGECENSAGNTLTALTKSEFYQYARQNLGEVFDAVYDLPHVPDRPRSYYLPRNLPRPTGVALREFLDRLNPATDVDRGLLCATMLTPGWGGPPGARPAFVFTSDFGQGVGKTETAKGISRIWGGGAPLNYEDDWGAVSKRIMSSEDWNSRIFLFDNVRGKFGGSAIEAAITAEHLTGHRMFVGTIKRPNDACFFVTFNLPELSRDMAQRSVVIKIGPPKTFAFVDWVNGFLAEHRMQLVSDLLSVLEGPPKCAIPDGSRDRWRSWQDAVLSRIGPGMLGGFDLLPGNLLAQALIERRPQADAGAAEADDIVRALANYLGNDGRLRDVEPVSSVEIYHTMRASQNWKSDDSRGEQTNLRNCLDYVKHRLIGHRVLMSKGQRGRVSESGKPTTGKNGRVVAILEFDWKAAERLTGEPRGSLFNAGTSGGLYAGNGPDGFSEASDADLGDPRL